MTEGPNTPPQTRKDTVQTLARLTRLVQLSLWLNAFLACAIAILAYVVFAVILAEPAQVAGVTDFERHDRDDDEEDYRIEMRTFFDRMTDVLDREARKQGVNPMDVVPTEDAINAAVETRTMHSDQSQEVLGKLRTGFELFDLAWPIAIPEM